MSSLKSELKQLVAYEIGIRVDDAREATNRGVAVLEGRNVALTDGAAAVSMLRDNIRKDVEEGKFTEETAQHVNRYIERCANALQTMAMQAEQQRLVQLGRAQGLAHTVELLKNVIEDEKKKRNAVPEDSVKTQRIAEDTAEVEVSLGSNT